MSLYGLQIATLLLPLVLIPFLARQFGPLVWGLLAMYTSLGGIMVIVLEFGFGFGATRSVAANRHDRSHISRTVADVLGARLLLSVAVVAVWIAIWFALPVVHGAASAYWWTLALTVVQGSSFAWYFQAVGRLSFAAILEIVARVISTALIFLLVHGKEDSGKVPALQFAILFVAFLMTLREMYKDVELRRPKFRHSIKMLRSNSYISGLRIIQSMTSMGNTFLVGAISPTALGIYGAAERTSNAVRSMFIPITQVAFPEFVTAAVTNRVRAQRNIRRVLATMVVLGLVGSFTLWFAAGPLVLLLFGEKFEGAIEAFRVLGLSLSLFAVSQTAGSQWMLALGHDRPFFTIVLGGFAVDFGVALWAVPRFGAVGMAWTFVFSELLMALAILFYVELLGPADTRIIRQSSAPILRERRSL